MRIPAAEKPAVERSQDDTDPKNTPEKTKTLDRAMTAPRRSSDGPGTGLSALGSLLALIAAIVVAIVGFVWFPLKRIMRKRKPVAGLAREDGGNEGPK